MARVAAERGTQNDRSWMVWRGEGWANRPSEGKIFMRRFVSYGPAFVVLITAVTVLLAAPGAIRALSAERARVTVNVARQSLDGDDFLARLNEATRNVGESVEPSVVHIDVSTAGSGRRMMRGSSGAGWVFDDGGHIITNAHVVGGAKFIRVQFFDGRVEEAELVGTDLFADVAVLKVSAAAHLVPAIRATGERIRRGDRVYAFGSPFGFKFSMSEGIVSGLGRSAQAATGFSGISNFIQTDAAVNPGNSGGPLVDVRGRVVGMNVAIATAERTQGTTEGQSAGISFAIPLTTIENRVARLLSGQPLASGWLGISYQGEAQYGKGGEYEGRGLLISEVLRGSGAEAAGVKPGDFITHINDEPAGDGESLRAIVGSSSPGDSVAVRIWRDGETLELRVTLGAVPREIEVTRYRRLLYEQFGLAIRDTDDGVTVALVDEDSSASRIGLKEGDVLASIDGSTPDSAAGVVAALMEKGLFNGRSVPLTIRSVDAATDSAERRQLILRATK